MKKVLLVGTSFSAVPIFYALKRRGFHITVCGENKSDPCHQYSDASIYLDYSDPEILFDVVKEQDFDYIVPTCNDFSYLSASKIANKMGFPGYDRDEITAILHTKKLFREITAKFNLKAPRAINYPSTSLIDIPLPWLIKPVDSFSGRGVAKINAIEEVSAAIKLAEKESRSGEVVVEEFIHGSLHSHSAFISNQRVVKDFFVDEFCTTYPYQVNCSNHPSIVANKIKLLIRTEAEKIAKELGITDGLLHTQFMSDGDRIWIIECMRRCPGDLYGSLIERSTGVDYADLFIRPFIGESYDEVINNAYERFCGRHTVSSKNPLVSFSYSTTLNQAKLEIVQLKESGKKLDAAPFDKIAIILVNFDDYQTMASISPNLTNYFKINIPGVME